MRQALKRRTGKGVQHESLSTSQLLSPAKTNLNNEPIQLGTSRFSGEERTRDQQLSLCFQRGEAGHRSPGCPHRPLAAPRVNIEHLSLLNNKPFTLPVTIKNEDVSLEFKAMIDSGAALKLINRSIVDQYNLPTQPCNPPIKIKGIDDTLIGEGIAPQTRFLTLHVGLFHRESIVDPLKHKIILVYVCVTV